MTTKYLDSKRIEGTAEDRAGYSAVSGGWKELGRISGSRTINNLLTVSNLADKRYYMILGDTQGTSTFTTDVRLNGDSGNNYSIRQSVNGASDATYQNLNNMNFDGTGQGTDKFGVGYIANLSTKEKLYQSHVVQRGSVGAGNDPKRGEFAGKWANTSNAITSIGLVNRGNGTSTGGELVVLGWDPDDTHTDNFWEELASVNLSGGSANLIDSGTFTAKKYLWIQLYVSTTGGAVSQRLAFNGDTGTNYAQRFSSDGGSDTTATGGVNIDAFNDDMVTNSGGFSNFFIVNNSANEKLGIVKTISQEAAGATAPTRDEGVLKWANTSSQITRLTFTNNKAGDMDTTTTLKVWGSN
jgi:hypothetical protein